MYFAEFAEHLKTAIATTPVPQEVVLEAAVPLIAERLTDIQHSIGINANRIGTVVVLVSVWYTRTGVFLQLALGRLENLVIAGMEGLVQAIASVTSRLEAVAHNDTITQAAQTLRREADAMDGASDSSSAGLHAQVALSQQAIG